MSGGSYNYLDRALRFDPADVFDRLDDLRRARDRLLGLGYRPEAKEVDRLVVWAERCLLLAETRAEDLSHVLHAVEWLDSSDWSETDMAEVIAKRRGEAE